MTLNKTTKLRKCRTLRLSSIFFFEKIKSIHEKKNKINKVIIQILMLSKDIDYFCKKK